MQAIPRPPVMSKSTVRKWQMAWILLKWCSKKMQVDHQVDVDVVPPASNFIKNKTSAQEFSCKLCDFF